MTRLLESRQQPWIGAPAREARSIEESDIRGFEVVQDSRIIDLRSWKPGQPAATDPSSLAFVYRRLKVFNKPEYSGDNLFPIHVLATSPKTAVRFPAQQLTPELSVSPAPGSTTAQKEYKWRASYDFQHVPAGKFVDLLVEYHSPGQYLERGRNGNGIIFPIRADTSELTTWIFMPEGKEYQSFNIIRYDTHKPDKVEPVQLVTEYLAEDFTIIAFKLLSLKSGHTYEISWTYR
jgi:hypothetical protein